MPHSESRKCEALLSPCAGIGLRIPHHTAFLTAKPKIGWVEVHSENYFSGPELRALEAVRADYPVSLHGVGLSLGSADGVDEMHLARVMALCDRIQPALVSEHLAWGRIGATALPDLLPLPLTRESLDVFCMNVDRVQTALKRTILVENPSTYLQFASSSIPEPEFLTAVTRRTGCGLICDINNIFVSAHNHGWDALDYLKTLPAAAIGEYHVAGHCTATGAAAGLLIDTHDRPVDRAVWALFEVALQIIGPRPVLIERDADLPSLEELLAEAVMAQKIIDQVSRRDANAA
ncbi:DUF692 domain-containing protein [Acidocella sp.]|uniref:MNIO family bufferin maturase n=1 Tax=Acidocella sp. TaxID=50710 RepID=UPI00184CA905|nr:DUF692 domain-containing protein [Acidocella sp.]NNM56826.1 DUF692 domain-containing protein [Acidocella sp.]